MSFRDDFRSDTLTKPLLAMRTAIASAEVGDAVYDECETTRELERLAAALLGKEAALFFPTGTQSNLAGIMAHCGRGDEYIVGQNAHTYRFEGGGAAVLGSVQPQPLSQSENGEIPLEAIQASIKADDFHFARTRLLALENTFNGGVLPAAYVAAATSLARQHDLATHLDGARLFNAAVASDCDACELASPFDSVSICLSKGLGAPVGSLLVGTRELVERARRLRKMLGGGMRQTGVLAAAGIYALQVNISRLSEDHARARHLAEILARWPGLRPSGARTNMVFIRPERIKAELISAFMAEHGIGVSGRYGVLRWVTHLDVDDNSLDRVEDALKKLAGRYGL